MMKQYKTPLSVATSLVFLLYAGGVSAFPIFSIDIPAQIEAFKSSLEQTKTAITIKDSIKTLTEVTNSIGGAVQTVSGYADQAQAFVGETGSQAEELEKGAMKYKEQFDIYSNAVKDKAEKVKFTTEVLKDSKGSFGELDEKLGGKLKDTVGSKLGIPSPDSDLSFIYPKDDEKTEEEVVEEEASETEAADEIQSEAPVTEKKGFRKRGDMLPSGANMKTGMAAGGKEIAKKDSVKALDIAKEKTSVPAVKANSIAPAVNKLKNEPVAPISVEKDKSFRQPKKLNMSKVEEKSFFYERAYPLVFADAAPEQKLSSVKTGQADDGTCIISSEMATFCDISVADLKKDPKLIRQCISDIITPPSDEDKMGMSRLEIDMIRRRNVKCALILFQQGANDAASESQNTDDLNNKNDKVTAARDLSAMLPFYVMELSKMFNATALARATDGVHKMLYDIESFDVKSFELKPAESNAK